MANGLYYKNNLRIKCERFYWCYGFSEHKHDGDSIPYAERDCMNCMSLPDQDGVIPEYKITEEDVIQEESMGER